MEVPSVGLSARAICEYTALEWPVSYAMSRSVIKPIGARY